MRVSAPVSPLPAFPASIVVLASAGRKATRGGQAWRKEEERGSAASARRATPKQSTQQRAQMCGTARGMGRAAGNSRR